MNLADIANAIAPVSTICGFIVAVGGLVLFGWRLRKQVIHVGEKADIAADASTRSADTATNTQQELEDTRSDLSTATAALAAATVALDTVRTAHDDLFAAFLRTQSVEARVRLLERWAEEQETTVHQLTRAMSTTGAAHADHD